MTKFVYALIFAVTLTVADYYAPVGDRSVVSSLVQAAQDYHDAAVAQELAAARTSSGDVEPTAEMAKNFGVRRLFGSKGHVETGLPTGPVFDNIAGQIEAGSRRAAAFEPPEITIHHGGSEMRVRTFGAEVPAGWKTTPQMPRPHCGGLQGRKPC